MTSSLVIAVLSLCSVASYDGWSFLRGPTTRATGFFRVEKLNGRWRAVDPMGRGFRPMGCDHVSFLGITCEALGYAPYHMHCKKTYPSDREWMDETESRLKSWGFNLLGNGAYNEKMKGRGFVYMRGASVSGKMCQAPDADPDLYIVRGRCPGSYLPNMFSPRYVGLCDEQARRNCAKSKDDPWLFGYYIDNELAWWCRGTLEEGLFDEVMKKHPTHSARIALDAFVNDRPITRRLKIEFLYFAARKYFEGACAAIRRHDPNHLILGCRFAGLGGAHDVVWKAAGEFCDVVSFNCYPYADLTRGVVLEKENGRPLAEVIKEMESKVGKPVYITEWSFLGLDTEKPCKFGAGQRLASQKDRAKAVELFLTTMIETGCCIGWNYFMWVDLPTLGTWKKNGEDGNYGLVREDGRPYEEVTAVFRRIQRGGCNNDD